MENKRFKETSENIEIVEKFHPAILHFEKELMEDHKPRMIIIELTY